MRLLRGGSIVPINLTPHEAEILDRRGDMEEF